jgi:NADH-quinone oxidoreductase subunit M
MRLDLAIYLSWLGVAAVLIAPAAAARWISLAAALAGLAIGLAATLSYDVGAATSLASSFVHEVRIAWVPSIGASYHLGADGISLPLVSLTGFVAVACVLMSFNIVHRAKEFFALLLVLIGAVYGVFLSLDLLLLFAFYELAIIPKYFMIAIWGSTKKDYAAMKLVLYSFVGSSLVFVGILALWGAAGATTFDLLALSRADLPVEFQFWCFPLVFFGFAFLAGMWPFHTWAPTGHSAAPTAASMMLAGVVMKLGAYGCLRVGIFLLPQGMTAHGHLWQTVIAVVAVIGIVYGAAVALVQRDFKFVVGYSSVSHMGFVLLGLATLNAVGVDGAVLQMFSHGVVASLLFGVVGRMVYDRVHTRVLDELSALRVARELPFAAIAFVVGGLASMGLPGFSGFVAEVQVFIGAWERFPLLAVVAGAGIVLAVWYTFRAMHAAFYGDRPEAPAHHALEPITLPEKLACAMLIALLVGVGLFPRPLLDMIDVGVKLLLAGGGR